MNKREIIKEFVRDNQGYIAPRIVADTGKITKIRDIHFSNGKKIKIKGKLDPILISKLPNTNLTRYISKIHDDSGSINVVWFNQYSLRNVNRSKEYIFYGSIGVRQGILYLKYPIFTTLANTIEWEKKLQSKILEAIGIDVTVAQPKLKTGKNDKSSNLD